ncbi:MAG: heat-inducible transcriptional repressor HrcA [Ignavibacterium sp.]|uniref:heat-inducible transcriptional repressor HrcA n=1 Tax=Ignavibacterium sp. TaxID=2651167 RepID=UPI00404A12D3
MTMVYEELNYREKLILRSIVHQFILTAAPVGSRYIAKKYEVGFSPATIRNVMADLEESGYINHPHTSAGRVPTDKGYRYYVDSLMEVQNLKEEEKDFIVKSFETRAEEPDDLLKVASKILSTVTHQIACVSYPKLDKAVLNKIQLIELSSNRLLVVVSVTSGLVKTITLEMDSKVNPSVLKSVESKLNEKLAGLTFEEIRNTFKARFTDVKSEEKPIIRLFFDSADKVFTDIKKDDKIVVTGATNIIHQPEFENPERFQSVVELIENKDIIIHILEKQRKDLKSDIVITIGSENEDEKLREYSLITKEYSFNDIKGVLGIIGPKRMEYPKIVSIVAYISEILSEFLRGTKR